VVSRLRAAQLMRGCTPHVPQAHKATTTAQLEVAAGLIARLADPIAAALAPKIV
jgi:hypothetical protein